MFRQYIYKKNPAMTSLIDPTYAAGVIGAIKDVDSNVRSELCALDKNLINGINSCASHVINSAEGINHANQILNQGRFH